MEWNYVRMSDKAVVDLLVYACVRVVQIDICTEMRKTTMCSQSSGAKFKFNNIFHTSPKNATQAWIDDKMWNFLICLFLRDFFFCRMFGIYRPCAVSLNKILHFICRYILVLQQFFNCMGVKASKFYWLMLNMHRPERSTTLKTGKCHFNVEQHGTLTLQHRCVHSTYNISSAIKRKEKKIRRQRQ